MPCEPIDIPASRSAHVLDRQASGLSETGGQDEEFRGQPALEEPGQRGRQVGRVAVIEAQPDVAAAGNEVEHVQEAALVDPVAGLARFQGATGRADAVEAQVHDL